MSRELLTAPRTYYVRSDALYTDAPGRLDTPAGACQTWQQAYNLAAQTDFGGNAVTLQHGNEAAPVVFNQRISMDVLTGGGQLHIRGSATPGKTTINPVTGNAVELRSTLTPVYFHDITFDGGEIHIMPAYLSTVNLMDGVVFGAASFCHMLVHDALAIVNDLSSHTTITGSTGYHILVSGGMAFVESNFVTLTGTPNFSSGYFGLTNGGRIQTVGTAFTGTATGPRYWVVMNSVLNTLGSGTTYLPGSVAGTTSTGGQYT